MSYPVSISVGLSKQTLSRYPRCAHVVPLRCCCSSACRACSRVWRSVLSAQQTWRQTHTEQRRQTSEYASAAATARMWRKSSVLLYHLWHSALRPFFFRANSASSWPVRPAHSSVTGTTTVTPGHDPLRRSDTDRLVPFRLCMRHTPRVLEQPLWCCWHGYSTLGKCVTHPDNMQA